MESVFILVVTSFTSAGACVLGIARLGFSKSGLWLALGKACECVGLMLIFSVLNLAVATVTILATRSISGRFVSIYIVSDTTFLMLAWLQALIFQAWREGSRRRLAAMSGTSDPLHRQP
jgi:hypothetical protein